MSLLLFAAIVVICLILALFAIDRLCSALKADPALTLALQATAAFAAILVILMHAGLI